ncbi:hypothetical protein [Salinisphaera sp. G21_0]|uniref:hypothetical protein n=1 Tax=Salinisphaera sp. G21_0 TaxID=2821094 RepID=UPI001AD9A49C|nr:hypothetical protein [Salinisphaera sp. G21_0]MBO9480163.1 hypothetical protein [Salinisphaera sp. G21_0]
MPYPHFSDGQEEFNSDRIYHHSPFDVPIEVVQNGLLWLLSDPVFHPLKASLSSDFLTVDELRDELVSDKIKLSSVAIDRVLDEIDRLVDDYRKGVAF